MARNRRYDPRQTAWRRGYDADWRRVRDAHLRDEPVCRICLARGYVVSATTVDHIVKIRDDPTLRLESSNLRSLCKPCHDMLGEHQSVKGCDVNGWPLDTSAKAR
jgi:5-methylcytosine-specific restriction protein A